MAGYWWPDSNSFYQLGQFFDFLKKAKQPGIPICQMQLRKVFFFSNGWQSEFRRDVFFSRGLGFHTKKSQKKWIIHLIWPFWSPKSFTAKWLRSLRGVRFLLVDPRHRRDIPLSYIDHKILPLKKDDPTKTDVFLKFAPFHVSLQITNGKPKPG